jgi:cell division septum initiation protein DivIVA
MDTEEYMRHVNTETLAALLAEIERLRARIAELEQHVAHVTIWDRTVPPTT